MFGNHYSYDDQLRDEGRAEGKAEGKAEGIEKGKAEAALEMLKDGLSVEKVAKYVEKSVEWVEALMKDLTHA